MRLHLPTRLFRVVIAMMVAVSSNLYADEVAGSISVTKIEDIQEYASSTYYVPFRIDSDLECDALTSPLMTYESGSRLFYTSDFGASVIFSNADSVLFIGAAINK